LALYDQSSSGHMASPKKLKQALVQDWKQS
jgi:hypothetical protein